MPQEANSLRPIPKAPQTTMHPLKAHAAIWHHVSQMPQDQLADKTRQADYAIPILAELSGNPDVKPRDVIKAAAQAAADGMMSPSDAVGFITKMPQDPDKLRPWLRQMYAVQMTAAVHMKAAQMKAGTLPIPQVEAAKAQAQPAAQPPDASPVPTAEAPEEAA
jgi:hypothetical protein